VSSRVSVAVFATDGLQYPSATDVLFSVYDHIGNELTRVYNGASLTFQPSSLVVADEGSIYLGGYTVAPGRIVYATEYVPALRKYHRDGVLQWSVNPGQWMSALAIDATTGDLLTTGPQNSNGDTTHRYSATGELLWSMDNGLVESTSGLSVYPASAYGCMAVDASGNLYIACAKPGAYSPDGTSYYAYTGMLTKWTGAGVKVWEFYHHGVPKSIALDSANSAIYYGVERAFMDEALVDLLKIDTDDGSVLASVFSGIPPVNNRSNERLVLTGSVLYGIGLGAYAQYDVDLVQTATWPVYSLNDLIVDIDGNHYFATNATASSNPGTGDFVVYDDYGWSASLVFEFSYPGVYCVNVGVMESPQLHGVHIPLALAAPTTQGDRYAVALGLPLSIGVQAPRWILEPTVRWGVQTFYRAWLDAPPLASLALPISYFSIRRTQNALALSVVCPVVTADLVDAMDSRSDGTLRLQSGYRYQSYPVQYVDVVSAPLTSIRADTGSSRASATLAGEQSDITLTNPQTRAAREVSYFSGVTGSRRVRCAPDIYLAPGDTLTWEGLSMTVGELTYSVSTTQALMEVTEAT